MDSLYQCTHNHSFLSYITSVDANTIATIFITLFVFFVGEVFLHWRKTSEEKVRLKRCAVVYSLNIVHIYEAFRRNLANIGDFARSIRLPETDRFVFSSAPMPGENMLGQIKQEDVIQIFSSNRYIKANLTIEQIYKLQRFVEYVFKQNECADDAFKDFMSHHIRIQERVNDSASKISTIIDAYRSFAINEQIPPDEMFRLVAETIKKFSGEQKTVKSVERLVIELLQLTRTHPEHKLADMLIGQLTECQRWNIEMDSLRSSYCSLFNDIVVDSIKMVNEMLPIVKLVAPICKANVD